MTYVLGLCQENVAAIISDNRATTGRYSGSNTVLKSGILFPGCIYGAAGNATEASRFIRACNRNLAEAPVAESGWDEFRSLAGGFAFRKHTSFEFLLATRHLGLPRLFHFESSKSMFRQVHDGFASGSGCRILNDSFLRIHTAQGPSVSERASKLSNLRKEDYPYLYCLLLMERIKGVEVSDLERAGIGGYLHFYYQTAEGDWSQRPAVYLIHSCRLQHLWVYRVALEGPALIIHDGDLPRPAVLINGEGWKGLSEMTESETSALGRNLVARSTAGSEYYFCGLGFSEPEYRGNNLIGLWREGHQMFSPSDGGKVSNKVDQFIRHVCSTKSGHPNSDKPQSDS